MDDIFSWGTLAQLLAMACVALLPGALIRRYSEVALDSTEQTQGRGPHRKAQWGGGPNNTQTKEEEAVEWNDHVSQGGELLSPTLSSITIGDFIMVCAAFLHQNVLNVCMGQGKTTLQPFKVNE